MILPIINFFPLLRLETLTIFAILPGWSMERKWQPEKRRIKFAAPLRASVLLQVNNDLMKPVDVLLTFGENIH